MIETHRMNVLGTHYSRLSAEECGKIHLASLKVLQKIGVDVHDEKAREILVKGGAQADGLRVRIPESMVKQALSTAPKSITLHDRKGNVAMQAGKYNTYYGGGSDCLNILDHPGLFTREKIEKIAETQVFSVIMPGASFFHNLSTSSAREMIDAGLPLAIATDFDPGSMPSCDMKFMQSLACIKYGMVPEEVINASTINSAYVMGIGEGYGTITRGKAANIFVTRKISSYQYFPYAFSSDLIDMVILDGEIH